MADIKRLNKIERDYEIHAHKTLQVPLTAENVLADHLLSADTTQSAVGAAAKTPADSLRDVLNAQAEQHQASTSTSTTAMPPLTATTTNFAAGGSRGPSINEIILNTKIQPNQYMDATEAVNASLTFDEGESVVATFLTLLSSIMNAYTLFFLRKHAGRAVAAGQRRRRCVRAAAAADSRRRQRDRHGSELLGLGL